MDSVIEFNVNIQNIYDSNAVFYEINPYICARRNYSMKLLLSISFLLLSTAYVGVAFDFIDLEDFKICFVDFNGDGSSEKESSEKNVEDDSEKNSYICLEFPSPSLDKSLLNIHSKNAITADFVEIPNPPPELV